MHTASTSSASSSRDDGETRLSPQRSTRNPPRRSVESSVTPPNDLQRLMASEVESLNSGVEPDGDNTGVRLRRVGESQKLRNRPSGKVSHYSPQS